LASSGTGRKSNREYVRTYTYERRYVMSTISEDPNLGCMECLDTENIATDERNPTTNSALQPVLVVVSLEPPVEKLLDESTWYAFVLRLLTSI